MRFLLPTTLLLVVCLALLTTICGSGGHSEVGAHFSRGDASYQKGEYDKAIKQYTAAIRLDPNFTQAYYSRGLAWHDKGKYDKAIKDYTAAIRLNPNHADAYYCRGLAWNKKGDYEKTIMDFRKANPLKPSRANSFAREAWVLSTANNRSFRDGQKALRLATRACEMSDWKNYYHINAMGAAYAESGDFKNAVKWQKKAIELSPNSLKTDYRSLLQLYEAKKPYRE